MKTYQDLLAAARQNPVGADFHSLRMAYTRSSGYAPYTQDHESLELLGDALRTGDMDAALQAVQTLLDLCYLDIEAHIAADYIHTLQGDEDQSNYHRLFAKGLLKAIMVSGDGETYETAFIVIDVPEQYTLLRALGLKPTFQALHQHDGHWFDVFNVKHLVSGETIQVYFNIDLPKTWLDKRMAADFGESEEE